MDKKQLTKMMAEMAALGTKYGFQVSAAGGSMTQTDATIKFKVRSIGTDGKTVTSAKAKAYAPTHGIDANRPFICRGVSYRIVDYRPRAKNHPWVAEDASGKAMLFSTLAIRQGQAAPMSTGEKKDGLAHLMA